MKMLLLLATCACGLSQAADGNAPAVSVEVVDPGWMPLPNMSVTITHVETCENGKGRAIGKAVAAQTDLQGCASFNLEKGSYVVAAGGEGGTATKGVCLSIYNRSPKHPTAHVQVQLKPASTVIVR